MWSVTLCCAVCPILQWAFLLREGGNGPCCLSMTLSQTACQACPPPSPCLFEKQAAAADSATLQAKKNPTLCQKHAFVRIGTLTVRVWSGEQGRRSSLGQPERRLIGSPGRPRLSNLLRSSPLLPSFLNIFPTLSGSSVIIKHLTLGAFVKSLLFCSAVTSAAAAAVGGTHLLMFFFFQIILSH